VLLAGTCVTLLPGGQEALKRTSTPTASAPKRSRGNSTAVVFPLTELLDGDERA